MRASRGLLAAIFLLASLGARAQDAALAVHLLDYIAVDYAEAVAGGKVRNAGEYKEMAEFAASVVDAIGKLPPAPEKAALEDSATRLASRVGAKAEPAEVSAAAGKLRQAVVAAYHVAIGPKRAPDLVRGGAIYAERCSSCHGANGLGDGIAARGLEPAPSNFHDRERQRLRSAHGLFNTVTRGVEGTSMRAFADLPEDDRWALAYIVANFGASDAERARGQSLWQAADKSEWSTHAAVAGRTAAEVELAGGADGVAIQAYLRAHPSVLDSGRPSPIAFARENLERSRALHAKGDIDGATRAALTAYLEGFELVEASLGAVDADLARRVEAAMVGYRNALESGSAAEVRALADRADALLAESQGALSTSLSAPASFAASLVILLREGLEAVLVVAALLAFLRRGGQAHAIRYVHAGWIAALALGAATWYVATTLVAVSGAHREVTEGVLGLVAAAMLLYVGFWLHDKSSAQAWQRFLMRGAGRGASWGLALMAFLAVYREVFETVLFYQALWLQAHGQEAAIAAGVGVALVALAAITFAMLRWSLRMPLGLFFGAGGILLAVLAVIMAGNGVAALQEAGWLPVTPVGFVSVSWLGIHPNAQAIGTQLLLAILVIALLRASSRRTAPQ